MFCRIESANVDPSAGCPHLLGFDWQEHVFPWSSANSICVQQTRPSLPEGFGLDDMTDTGRNFHYLAHHCELLIKLHCEDLKN